MICEPYRSCSLFGALRIVANLKNVVSIIHGPTGCSFYARNSIIRLNGYYSAKSRIKVPLIYTTDFNERDTIFGGVDKLRKAVAEIIGINSPDAVFIFNSCVSEIIGEDINSVAEDMARSYHIPVIPFHTAGFKGDHKLGMKMANQALFENFIAPFRSQCDNNRVNILGDYDYFNRSSSELTRIIERIPGKKAVHIPGCSSLAELTQASCASMNIITCNNASRYLAELMKSKFGIPFIGTDTSMYGLDNCYAMYLEIFGFYNADNTVVKKYYYQAKSDLEKYLPVLNGKTAAIVAGTRRAFGYASLLAEFGINVELIFTESSDESTKQNLLQYSRNIMCDSYPDRLYRDIDRINPDYVFSTLPEIVAPNKYVMRNDEDYSGFSGAIKLAEYLSSVKKDPGTTAYIRMEN